MTGCTHRELHIGGKICYLWLPCCLVRRIADIMDITSEDFVNKNLYEFCHAEDLQKLHKAHVDCK